MGLNSGWAVLPKSYRSGNTVIRLTSMVYLVMLIKESFVEETYLKS